MIFIYILSCIISLNACSKKIVKLDNNEYKGGALHTPLPFNIFPHENSYSLSSISDSLLKNKLDDNIETIISTQNINGISMSILIPNKGIWQLNSGYIEIGDSTLVDSTSLFYWASVSKLITSTIIHQLILEQKLEATDKLSKWFPQFEQADEITIKQLLQHTNGIYSFNNDSTFHFSNRFHAPSELLGISLSEDNLFSPGEYWSYNNTGYLLLALISEDIESKSFSQIVQERISAPQNLSSLQALAPNEQPANLALAHHQGLPVEAHYSTPLGAGNIVGSSKDMTLFFHALLTGKYIPMESVHNMLGELYPMFNAGQYYGAGIMLYDFNEINNSPNQWIGHSGGIENYKAILIFDIKKQVMCSLSVSQSIPVEAIALSMLNLINE